MRWAWLPLWIAGCTQVEPPVAESEDPGCVSCHQGIEPIHEAGFAPTECTWCHGGDGVATAKEAAHVAVPENWAEVRGTALPPAPTGFIKDMAPDQLDRLDPNYLRFVNPGDIRVAEATCGSCHPEQARNMPYSIMSTNAGHYYPTLFLAGFQLDRLAHYASFGASNPDCDTSIPGAVCEVETIVPPTDAEATAVLQGGDPDEIELLANKHYLAKNCNTCHQAGYPRNDSPGLYRSAGCSACHMVYAKDGTYQGDDPTLPRGAPVHAARHTLTTAIPVETCASCHFQGGRIGLAYRGIREGGFSNKPEHGLTIDETLNGRAPGFYYLDEDTTNEVDETPPDLHYAAGMVCVDCHVDQDVHGTGQILSSSKQQVGITCEDCHGTVRARVAPDANGRFTTAKGRRLPQLQQDEDGRIFQIGAVDGVRHDVPQVVEVLQTGNDDMHAAMAPDANDWSHTDSLTCDTCHTSWQQTCIGCHVSVDFRLTQTDYQTGTATWGLTKGSRTDYTLEQVLLGTAPDGRVQSVQASQQVQMAVFGAERFGVGDGELMLGGSYVDADGATKTDGAFRHAGVGIKANNGFTTFFQHTTSSGGLVRTCDACHRTDRTPEEDARIQGVYGHGTGEFMLLDPTDLSYVDGLQWLDAYRNPTTLWQQEGTGPLRPEVYDRAFGVVLSELP